MTELDSKNKELARIAFKISSSQLAERMGMEKKEVNREIRELFPAEIDGGCIPTITDTRGYVEAMIYFATKDRKVIADLVDFYLAMEELSRRDLQIAGERYRLVTTVLEHLSEHYPDIAKDRTILDSLLIKRLLDAPTYYRLPKLSELDDEFYDHTKNKVELNWRPQ